MLLKMKEDIYDKTINGQKKLKLLLLLIILKLKL